MNTIKHYALALLLGFSVLPALSLAAHEGGPVSEGPVTALDKLESVSELKDAAISRRNFSIQHWKTKNGARVYFVEARELPMLDIRFVFDAGAARDGNIYGLANTVNRMLDEGTPTRNTDRIARDFERVGAEFSASSHRDMAVVEMRVLSDPKYRDAALNVFADVVANPQFPAEPLARIQQSSEVGLQQQEQSPSTLATRKFYKALYGSHPYAEPPTGTKSSLAKITREGLKAFHKRYYVANNLVIALVGAVSRAEAEAIAEQATAQLAAGQPAEKLPVVPPLKKAQSIHHEFASSQTHIMVGQPGIRHGDSDSDALAVGNEILGGGGFTSRLMKELRQNRGMTYGVYSRFTSMREAGPFAISLSTRADQTNEALTVINQILNDFVKNGPSDGELEEAKASILQSFPLSTSSNASIGSYLGMIAFYGLPLDYLDTYPDRIRAVSKEDVTRAFKRHLQPSQLLTVTVGQRTP